MFQTLESTFLTVLTLISAGWGLLQLRRHRGPEASGALAASGVLGLALVASLTELSAWQEGGWEMVPLTLLGAYAVGSATAAFVAPALSGPRKAALVAVALVLGTSVWARVNEMREVREVLERVNPEDRQAILDGASKEAWRPVQLGALFGGLVAVLLTRRRGARALAPDLTAARATDR